MGGRGKEREEKRERERGEEERVGEARGGLPRLLEGHQGLWSSAFLWREENRGLWSFALLRRRMICVDDHGSATQTLHRCVEGGGCPSAWLEEHSAEHPGLQNR